MWCGFCYSSAVMSKVFTVHVPDWLAGSPHTSSLELHIIKHIYKLQMLVSNS